MDRNAGASILHGRQATLIITRSDGQEELVNVGDWTVEFSEGPFSIGTLTTIRTREI